MERTDLILPPTQIDLSQTIDYQTNVVPQNVRPVPAHELRDTLVELLDSLKNITSATFDQQREHFEAKIAELSENVNLALNDLDRRLEGINNMHYELQAIVHSFLLLNLAGDQMPEEVRRRHETILEQFLISLSHAQKVN